MGKHGESHNIVQIQYSLPLPSFVPSFLAILLQQEAAVFVPIIPNQRG